MFFEMIKNRYAQEFNEKVKNRERLKANIKQYINETSKKLDEFWAWEANERENRNDKTACFKRYVKLVREGQIKII
jgi:predicted solute-binding protein